MNYQQATNAAPPLEEIRPALQRIERIYNDYLERRRAAELTGNSVPLTRRTRVEESRMKPAAKNRRRAPRDPRRRGKNL